MKESARYVKRVEWSDEDRCFVGSCPGVIGPCCHGDDEVAVYRELCGIVDEWLEVIRDALPPRGSGGGGETGRSRPTAGYGIISESVGRQANGRDLC